MRREFCKCAPVTLRPVASSARPSISPARCHRPRSPRRASASRASCTSKSADSLFLQLARLVGLLRRVLALGSAAALGLGLGVARTPRHLDRALLDERLRIHKRELAEAIVAQQHDEALLAWER